MKFFVEKMDRCFWNVVLSEVRSWFAVTPVNQIIKRPKIILEVESFSDNLLGFRQIWGPRYFWRGWVRGKMKRQFTKLVFVVSFQRRRGYVKKNTNFYTFCIILYILYLCTLTLAINWQTECFPLTTNAPKKLCPQLFWPDKLPSTNYNKIPRKTYPPLGPNNSTENKSNLNAK